MAEGPLARATGLEPATSSVTGKIKLRFFIVLNGARHRFATSIGAQACEHAAGRLFVAAFQQMPVLVQRCFDIFMPHEGLYRLKVFAIGNKNRRIEMA